jgi:hypothetical protein
MHRRFGVVWLIGLVFVCVINQAQTPPQTIDIYLLRGVGNSGADRLTFIDVFSGTSTSTEVVGERYTVLGDSLIYFDYRNQRVMSVGTDGIPRPHPFVQLLDGARRVDWVVSHDKRFVAWTLTYGDSTTLSTVTSVATAEGANRREILIDGARSGIRAMPVGFNAELTHVYMDAQPDGIGQFTPYTQYAGLFSVDIASSAIQTLPNEPNCFCAAGFMSELYVRLSLSATLNGFDVQFYNLRTNSQTTIPSMPFENYTQAGDVLIAPDGTLAVYALSNVSNFGTPQQAVQTIFMLVDLRNISQTPLTDPITTYIHPVRWTENNHAIVFTSPQIDGTWKITLADRQLKKVADETYVGTLTRNP